MARHPNQVTMTNSSSKLRVLVSGGAGFLGSNLIHGLNARGITDITIVDRLGSGSKWRNLVGLQYSEHIEVDAFRARRLAASCDYDVVLLLGACSSTRESNASYLMENNVRDMVETIEWARIPHLVPHPSGGHFSRPATTRVIYASSAATYGAGPSDDSIAPSDLRPLNAYALSKNMVDQTLDARGLLDKVIGLKYHNVFGPNSQHKGVMTDFVAKTYDQIKTTGLVTLYDTHLHGPEVSGINVRKDARDFLYVKDAVDMTLFFALDEIGRRANGLFNIGSGAPASWTEIAALTLKAAIGYSADVRTEDYIRYQPMPSNLRAQYQYYTCADIGKLRAAGYSAPITPLADAIKDYVTQYLVPDKRRGEVS